MNSTLQILKIPLQLALGLGLVACQVKNPPLSGPPRDPVAKINYKTSEANATGITVEIDTRVDLLFVFDDSASMKNHQANLSRNVHHLINAITQVKSINLHVGYTVSHDRTRYGSIVPEKCPDGRVNWEVPGSLRALKGPASKLPKDGRRFVKSGDDLVNILRDSLDPNINTELVKPFINKTVQNPDVCPYGPEEEELFTPLLGALDNPIVTEGSNKGFRRPGALFVAILISDAKDASGITPQDVLSRIHAATGGPSKTRVFAVAFKPGTRIGTKVPGWEQCKPDPAWSNGRREDRGRQVVDWPTDKIIGEDENPLATLARLTQDSASTAEGHVLSICDSNYGSMLAKLVALSNFSRTRSGIEGS